MSYNPPTLPRVEADSEVEDLILHDVDLSDSSKYHRRTNKKKGLSMKCRCRIVIASVLVVAIIYNFMVGDSVEDEQRWRQPQRPYSDNNNDDQMIHDGLQFPSPNSDGVTPALSPLNDGEGPAPAPAQPTPEPTNSTLLSEKYGSWGFWDSKSSLRTPHETLLTTLYGLYPHHDVPASSFPSNAWQVDAVYVNHFLDAAGDLVRRAKIAIWGEYGWEISGGNDAVRGRERRNMWKVDMTDSSPPTSVEWKGKGGWTTPQSFNRFTQRLLHSMMTNGNFTVVVLGGDNAAGYGNHFRQSAAMQLQVVMGPVFQRLGMTLVTRNMAMGSGGSGIGFSFLEGALGAGEIYGDDIDLVIWDGAEEEGREGELELLFRQMLMRGRKPPALWVTTAVGGGGGGDGDEMGLKVLKHLNEQFGVDIMVLGNGMSAIPTTTASNILQLPDATKYLKCPSSNDAAITSLCDDNDAESRYRTVCWIPRDDLVPTTPQLDHIPTTTTTGTGTTTTYYPGWREHRLKGRMISFAILNALQDGVDTWSDNTIVAGHPLADEYWHTADYYKTVTDKIWNRDDGDNDSGGGDGGTYCDRLSVFVEGKLPRRVCSVPLKTRTEWTPRVGSVGLTSIIKPIMEGDGSDTGGGYTPYNKMEMLYKGEDVENSMLNVRVGEVDVVTIVGLGLRRRRRMRERLRELVPPAAVSVLPQPKQRERYLNKKEENEDSRVKPIVQPGKGWEISTAVNPGQCDGALTSICGRRPDSDCLLAGRIDSRGGLVWTKEENDVDGIDNSGWLVLGLGNVTEGIVVIRVELSEVRDGDDDIRRLEDTNMNVTMMGESRNSTESNNNSSSSIIDDPAIGSNNTTLLLSDNDDDNFNATKITTNMTENWENETERISNVTTLIEEMNGTSSDKNANVTMMIDQERDDNTENGINTTNITHNETSLQGFTNTTDSDNEGEEGREWTFEYAINGNITPLTKEEFTARAVAVTTKTMDGSVDDPQQKQRREVVASMLTILDNPDLTTTGGDGSNMEVAIRLRNCGKGCKLTFTHVYWA